MRTRVTFLLVAILVTAVFVALNWPEFMRPVPVSLGVTIVDAPLSLILLAALVLALLGALGSATWLQTSYDRALGRQTRALQAQRELADKAEASRFTELRRYLDAQTSEARQREVVINESLQATLLKGQRELQARLDAFGDRLDALPDARARAAARALPPHH